MKKIKELFKKKEFDFELRSPTYGEKTDADILSVIKGKQNEFLFIREITYRMCCKHKPEDKTDYKNELVRVKRKVDNLSLAAGKNLREAVIKFLNKESDDTKK